MKIYNGYERLARNYTLLSDEYEFTMGKGYLLTEKDKQEAVFDIFFREVPNKGGYAVMAGLDKLIPYIQNLRFTDNEIRYFERRGYGKEFINYLKNFKFTGDIYAVPDGTPVFPNEPLVTIKAPIIEAQIVETALLTMLNGAMEHATGARRIIEALPEGVGVMEFGARRADGPEAAIDASIYGIMAGCVGTSNIIAADMLNMDALGTMAHSWIEAFPTEFEAFKEYARIYPDNCILLVDTYDTLRSGIPNAIKTFKYMKDQGINPGRIGIRIDSGDLAYQTKEARKMLDAAGFPNALICVSNALNDKKIEALVKEGAYFNQAGVGDNISKPEGRMGLVYKLAAIFENNVFVPKIKLSGDTVKIINPGFKQLYRAYDNETGFALCDVIASRDEKVGKNNILVTNVTNFLESKTISNFRLEKLQKPIFINGELVYDDPEILEKKDYCNKQMATLYREFKRPEDPEKYFVDGTEPYIELKKDMINKTKKLVWM